MNGGQCLAGALDLYAVAGEIRQQFVTLQGVLHEQQKVTR